MGGSSTFAASGGMEVETSAGFLSSSCPAMVATEFAMRFTGVRKSGISMKASTIAINQKRCSCVSSASRHSKAIRSSRIFFDLCAIRSGSEWMVKKITRVRMMHAISPYLAFSQVPTARKLAIRKKQAKRPERLIWIKGPISQRGLASLQARRLLRGSAMPEKIDDLLPTAKEAQKQIAIKEAEK